METKPYLQEMPPDGLYTFVVIKDNTGRLQLRAGDTLSRIQKQMMLDKIILDETLGFGQIKIDPGCRQIRASASNAFLENIAPQSVVEQIVGDYASSIGYKSQVEMGRSKRD
ncbi:MAG: hypothetical protein KJ955_07785 [Nanoarchaeota archaeon]|nr:hypothetical protein [Nanoarchaeota archaeon]